MNAFVTYFDWGKLDIADLADSSKNNDRVEIIQAAMTPICNCGNCHPHLSDCSVHDGESAGACDCR